MATLFKKVIRMSHVPDQTLLGENLQQIITDYFKREENGGGEVLSYACDSANSSLFVSIRLSIEGTHAVKVHATTLLHLHYMPKIYQRSSAYL